MSSSHEGVAGVRSVGSPQENHRRNHRWVWGVTHPHTTCLLPTWEGQVTVALDTKRLDLIGLEPQSPENVSRGDAALEQD